MQVLSVAVNSGLVAYPVRYSAVYETEGLTVWEPVPPSGYVALGCLATPGDEPPALTEVVCVHAAVGIEAPLGSCLILKVRSSTLLCPGDCSVVDLCRACMSPV
jgi:hypothetical protein